VEPIDAHGLCAAASRLTKPEGWNMLTALYIFAM
jgi:hypothetical protein